MNARTKHAPIFTVRQQAGSLRFGVYRNGDLVEGGFFSRDKAEECRRSWVKEYRAAIAKATGEQP